MEWNESRVVSTNGWQQENKEHQRGQQRQARSSHKHHCLDSLPQGCSHTRPVQWMGLQTCRPELCGSLSVLQINQQRAGQHQQKRH